MTQIINNRSMTTEFIKPIESCKRQTNNNPYYYIAVVSNYKTFTSKYNLYPQNSRRTRKFFNRKEIDKIPKRHRRGGIYGHDTVRLVLDKRLSPLWIRDHVDDLKLKCRKYALSYKIYVRTHPKTFYQ